MHNLALGLGVLAAAGLILSVYLFDTGRPVPGGGVAAIALLLASQAWRLRRWIRRMDSE